MLTLLPLQRPAPVSPVDPVIAPYLGVRRTRAERVEDRCAEMRRVGATVLARSTSAGIREVALAVGVHPSTAFYTYPRREVLIHDILLGHLNEAIEVMGNADDAHREAAPPTRLELALCALFGHLLANRDAHRLAYSGLASVSEPARDQLAYLMKLIIHRLYMILEAALPTLATARELQAPVARGLLASVSDAALWFRDDGSLSRADYARLLTEQTLTGARAALASYKAAQREA